ncbi:PIG-L family deacetylase, partial [Actinocrinis puniceicyclus]
LRAELPRWRSVLVVVAHPDDETFGLGAVVNQMIERGAAVHVLCFSHGESSTLGDTSALFALREEELREASARLGVRSVTLLTYPDGHLDALPAGELSRQVALQVARVRPDGLLVFDDTGVTAHPDHRAATAAALLACSDLPVLAWALPSVIADRLRQETGQPFVGRLPGELDLCLRVARAPQRRAAFAHASQLSPTAVFWRRIQLQGECEHLRWLRRPSAGQRD